MNAAPTGICVGAPFMAPWLRINSRNKRRGAINGALVTYKPGGEWMRQGRMNTPWPHECGPYGDLRRGAIHGALVEYKIRW